ncbi:FUSC family protein [Nocardioides sp. YIM 152588]|uniref:FUSC family protein n=1 Tax=Nocardioides sp. YIM 152588 TaxID=3158259 RepID=UPI0032E4DB27
MGDQESGAATGAPGLARRVRHELRRFGPAPPTRVAAVRTGLTLLVPLLVLLALDRLDLAIYATFGAFTAVYGGAAVYAGRWRQQVSGGLALLLAVATGCLTAALDAGAWAVVPVAAAWASIAAATSDLRGWRPPGPMFVVFAVATTASVPLTAADLPAALLTAAATAALGLCGGVVEERLTRPRTGPPPVVRRPRHREVVQLVRCAAAVAVSGAAMTAAGVPHPSWAMAASVVPLARPGLHLQLASALHRVAGTVAGLVLAGTLLWLDLPALAVVLLLAALQVGTELLITRHYGLALVLITPLALLAVQLSHPEPAADLVLARLAETLVGVAVGVLAAVLTRERAGRGRRG